MLTSAKGKVCGSQLLHGQDDVAALARRGRIGYLEIASDHQLDHCVMGHGVAFEMAHDTAIPQDDHAVACLHHLVQPMRDEHHRDAVCLERGDHLEQLLGFRDRQARCRLVEDHEPRVQAERLGDLDNLPLRERKPGHCGRR